MALSLKEELIEKVGKELNLEKDKIELIINHQGESALKAVKEHNQVEFSGFGKFLVSNRKLRNSIHRLNNILLDLEKKPESETVNKKIEGVKIRLTKLLKKQDEIRVEQDI